eukprot:UN34232
MYCASDDMWEQTVLGATASVVCPDNDIAITRKCLVDGIWQEPNLSLCPSFVTGTDADITEWSAHETSLWIQSLDAGLIQTAQVLETEGVTGDQLIAMGINDFVNLGIQYGHSNYIWHKVQEYLENQNPGSQTTTTTEYPEFIANNNNSEDDSTSDIIMLLIVGSIVVVGLLCCMFLCFWILVYYKRKRFLKVDSSTEPEDKV